MKDHLRSLEDLVWKGGQLQPLINNFCTSQAPQYQSGMGAKDHVHQIFA